MKTLDPAPKFMLWAVWRAVRHPRTPLTYVYCPDCRVRLHSSVKECPKCHRKAGGSPELVQASPIPWYGSVMVIILGIICLVLGAGYEVDSLGELGRVLIIFPLGNLFGMSLPR